MIVAEYKQRVRGIGSEIEDHVQATNFSGGNYADPQHNASFHMHANGYVLQDYADCRNRHPMYTTAVRGLNE